MSTTDKTGVTPEIGDVVRSIVDTVLLDLNVCLPGKISTYNKDTQYADIQIQLMHGYSDGTLVVPAIIPNVPVKHARAQGGKAFIHMPLKAGDDVTLIFSQRSLDNWKSQGGMSDPDDPRKHHITDCYALIGGSAIPDAFKPTTADCIEVVNDKAKSILHPDGKIELLAVDARTILHPDGTYNFFGGNGDDFVQVVNDLILGIQRAYVETWDGPEPLIDPLDPLWEIIQLRCQAFVNGPDPYMGV